MKKEEGSSTNLYEKNTIRRMFMLGKCLTIFFFDEMRIVYSIKSCIIHSFTLIGTELQSKLRSGNICDITI